MKKLSYWRGDNSEPLKNLTIGQLVDQASEKYANRTAISVFGGQKLTYGEVSEKVNILASAMMNLGLKTGDHVALWGFNTADWYLTFLAASKAGFITVNLNPLYQSSELLSCLIHADVKALIMDDYLGDHNFYEILKKVIPDIEEYDYNVHIMSKKAPLLKTIIVMSKQSFRGTFKWCDLLSAQINNQKPKIEQNLLEISPFDVCNLQFTSGTTSTPKCVMLNHHNMINSAHIAGNRKNLQKKPHRICLQVPFFHVYGLVQGILGVIDSGCHLILPSAKFSPNKSIDCIIIEKCTVVYGTPTMYNDILTVVSNRASNDNEIFTKMSSVEILHSGGAICLPETIRKLKEYFQNSQFMSGYGMTESSAATLISLLQDPDEILLSTVGRVIDHVEVKVIDKDNQIVPIGIPGELCCRGYNTMKGYYKNPLKTEEILDNDGWLHTGDQFILRDNGYGEIVGRIKDIIIRGSENIAPKEIEELLIKHPNIVDVQIYGVKDPRLGEAVAAAIIKAPNSSLNEQDIKQYCKELIASYKIPQYVTFVKKFPVTASGKIIKVKLKEMTESSLIKNRDGKTD